MTRRRRAEGRALLGVTVGALLSNLAVAIAAGPLATSLPLPATVIPAPLPPLGLEKLSLQQALERALSRNVSVVVAEAAVRKAAATVTQVRASSLPTLVASGTWTHLDDDRRIDGQVLVPADQLSGNIALTVPLLSPQRWAQWAHAADDRNVARAEATASRRQVAVSTAHAYLAVVSAQRVIESNERARELALAHYGFAFKRLSGGVGSELDAVRALQTLREDGGRVEAARATLLRAQGELGVLLGLDRPVDISVAPNFQAAHDPVDSLELLAQRRSDLLALSGRLAAARRVRRDSWTDFLPSLAGVLMPMYQNPGSVFQPTFAWQLQLQLTVPIFDGGFRYGLLHMRSAIIDEAKAQFDSTLFRGRAELQVGFSALDHQERARSEALEAAQLAQRAVEIAELSYRHGATTNLELLDAQRRARDASTAAVMAEDELQRVRVDLLAAAGLFP